jgi:outer membrane protein assembly factor BamB
MHRRQWQLAAAALAALACSDVAPLVPELVEHPTSAFQSQPVEFRVTSRAPDGKPVVLVADWGDGRTDTSAVFGSGDTATMRHAWAAPGSYEVGFRAALAGRPEAASEPTDPVTITVLANGVPAAPTLRLPPRAVPDAWAFFQAQATDPDADSVQYLFDYGGTVGAWTGFTFGAVEDWALDSHRFAQTGLVAVRAKARDGKGSESDWSPAEMLVVGEAGVVRWQFSSDGMPDNCAPLVVRVGAEEVVFVAGESLYAIGREVRAVGPAPTGDYLPYLAWCEQTGHVIVGRDDRCLVAFTPSLVEAWSVQPDSGREADVDVSTLAVAGNRLYVLFGERLWCVEDRGTGVRLVGCRDLDYCSVPPVVCQDGGVVTSDGGVVMKLAPDLNRVLWSTPTDDDEITAIAIGSAGEVYYAGWDGWFGAISADGTPLWSECVNSSVTGIAVGRDRVFFTAELSEVYCRHPAGNYLWDVAVPTEDEVGEPTLTANGLLYLVDDGGLWCLRQADGGVEWFCPLGWRRRSAAQEYTGVWVPALNAQGDIFVSFDETLFCVAGYAAGTLDPAAPWPKWQRDAHNTGRAR